jgi:hypothetical protein
MKGTRVRELKIANTKNSTPSPKKRVYEVFFFLRQTKEKYSTISSFFSAYSDKSRTSLLNEPHSEDGCRTAAEQSLTGDLFSFDVHAVRGACAPAGASS